MKATDVPGWMTEQELQAIESLVAGKEPKIIVEVGSWCGRSLCQWYLSSPIGSTIIAVDLFVPFSGGVTIPPAERRCILLSNVYRCEQTRPDVKFRLMHMDSTVAATEFKDRSVDLVFIDGDHEEEAVRKDIQAWQPKIKPEGLLAGHDYGEHGVTAAVNALLPDRLVLPKTSIWIWEREH